MNENYTRKLLYSSFVSIKIANIAFVATCAIPGGSATKIPKAIAVVKDIIKVAKAANMVIRAVNTATEVTNTVQYFEDNASKKSEKSSSAKNTSGGSGSAHIDPNDKDKKKSARLINTAKEREDFIKGKIAKGICQKDKIIDGRQAYKVLKKDGELKKGDFLTSDKRHDEIELFNSSGEHKGAIE
jgi:hypothetical protein